MNVKNKIFRIPRLMAVIFLLTVSGTAVLPAQSVDSLIRLMEENNPGLRSLEKEYEAASYAELEHEDLPDPHISMGFAPIPFTPMMGMERFRVGVMQSLPWNNVLKNRRNVAREQSRRLRFDYEINKADLALLLRQGYAEIWKINQEIELLRQRIPIIEAWHQVSLSLMSVNKAVSSDVMQIEIFINEIQNSLDLLRQERNSYLVQMTRIVGTDSLRISEFDNLIRGEAVRDSGRIMVTGMDDLPDLRRFDQELRISAAVLEQNKTERMPEISLGLDYGIMDMSGTSMSDYKGMSMVMPMVSVSVPIYRKKYEMVEQREKARQVSIDLQKEDRRLQIKEEVNQAKIRIRQEENNLSFYEKQLEIVNRTIDIMHARYSAEGEKFEELLKVQNKLIDIELQQLESKASILLAQLTIDRWQS